MRTEVAAPPAALRWEHLAAIARRAADATSAAERFTELRVLEHHLRGEEGDVADVTRELLSIGLKLQGLLTKGQARALCLGLVVVAKAAAATQGTRL